MSSVHDRLRRISVPPDDKTSFDRWLTGEDGFAFLRDNVGEREFVVYAGVDFHTFILTVLAPADALATPDVDDLLSWDLNTGSSWSTVYSKSLPDGVSLLPLLHDAGSKSFKGGEQLVFSRHFDGYTDDKNYFEVLQKFLHIMGLHHVPHRKAYCRLDKHGDLEDVVRIVEVSDEDGGPSGTIITFYRDFLDEYAVLTHTTIVRAFDFTMHGRSFGGWPNEGGEEHTVVDGDILYRRRIYPGYGSYVRGCQIIRPMVSKQAVAERFWGGEEKEKKYASFIAHDWKNNVVREISCAPGATANYFTKSDLPYEVTPAFFRPEVLSKYKADSDKYRLEARSISCRGAWHLKTYDINDQGQVHTYLVYLRSLPYEEQLHWKQFNEPPKGPISKRAIATDFEGSFNYPLGALATLKGALHRANERRFPWWKPRPEKLFDQVHEPVTSSADEWANEILHLDQLLVEGFDHKWLKRRATELNREPAAALASLKLIEECLLGLGYEPSRAQEIVGPLRDLHHLRTKVKGHAGDKDASAIRQATLAKHGTYRKHFETLCAVCDESFRAIAEALGTPLDAKGN